MKHPQVFHCDSSQQRFHFCFERFHSRLCLGGQRKGNLPISFDLMLWSFNFRVTIQEGIQMCSPTRSSSFNRSPVSRFPPNFLHYDLVVGQSLVMRLFFWDIMSRHISPIWSTLWHKGGCRQIAWSYRYLLDFIVGGRKDNPQTLNPKTQTPNPMADARSAPRH